MGYRSNIRCLIYPMDTSTGDKPTLVDNYHALKTVLNTAYKDVLDMWKTYWEFDDAHNVFDFAVDDVKWYDSYPDVVAFESMLKEVEELGYCYEFIRVGEDNDDVECKESPHSNGYLNTRTEITCYF